MERATALKWTATLAALAALVLPGRARPIIGLLDPIEPQTTAARPRGGAGEADFRRWAERLVGNWECRIREYDGVREEPVWEARQRRTFTLVLQGRFVEEAAYVFDASGWVQAGLQLISFEEATGRVLESGFWSDSPGRLFAVEGTLRTGSGRGERADRIDGTMTLRTDLGSVEKRRVAIVFEGADRHLYRVFRQRPDGSEYLHEELLYTRLG